MSATASLPGGEVDASRTALYRAVWRWHFFAGLFVLPFMILLAMTGGLYLYKDEINSLLYDRYLNVAPSGGPELKPSDILARATAEVPGEPVGYVPPAAPDRSAQVKIKPSDGENRIVFVDPYSGIVLGALSDGGAAGTPFMLTLRRLHSLEYFGWLPNRVIELVAGWTIVLVVTGFYLWWPRGASGGAFAVRGQPGRRVFWRDVHAVTGAYAGLFVLFLALSGLPWSGFWGAKLNSYADQMGLGYPPQYWNEAPKSHVHMKEAMTEVPWSLENVPMPESTPAQVGDIGIDRAVEVFQSLGLHRGYAIDLPAGPAGVYSASIFADQVANQRVVHLDRYTGQTLFDGGFADLGPVGKAVEWGISVHMGQEFGLINQLLMTAACLSIVLMAIAAAVMWWKRRPKGSLGAPRVPDDYRIARGALMIAALLGFVFPLVGLSILAMLAIDRLLPASLKERLT